MQRAAQADEVGQAPTRDGIQGGRRVVAPAADRRQHDADVARRRQRVQNLLFTEIRDAMVRLTRSRVPDMDGRSSAACRVHGHAARAQCTDMSRGTLRRLVEPLVRSPVDEDPLHGL